MIGRGRKPSIARHKQSPKDVQPCLSWKYELTRPSSGTETRLASQLRTTAPTSRRSQAKEAEKSQELLTKDSSCTQGKDVKAFVF